MQNVTRAGADIDDLAVRKFINVTTGMVLDSRNKLYIDTRLINVAYMKYSNFCVNSNNFSWWMSKWRVSFFAGHIVHTALLVVSIKTYFSGFILILNDEVS